MSYRSSLEQKLREHVEDLLQTTVLDLNVYEEKDGTDTVDVDFTDGLTFHRMEVLSRLFQTKLIDVVAQAEYQDGTCPGCSGFVDKSTRLEIRNATIPGGF